MELSFANYSFFGSRYNKIISKLGFAKLYRYNKNFLRPSLDRSINISSRFNINYSRKVIAWQRKL